MNQQQLKENLLYLGDIKTCINTFNEYYHDNKFINLLLKKIDKEIKKTENKIEQLNDWNDWNRKNNIYWGWDDKFLNNERFNSGYITDVDSDKSVDNYSDDDTSCNSKYDQDKFYDKIIENNNDNWNNYRKKNKLFTIYEEKDIQNKYKRIGERSFDFHIDMNDHHLHHNCKYNWWDCGRKCETNNYICGATIPMFNSVNKNGYPTQYMKCGYVCEDINNCIHNCKGLYLEEKNTIIRFRIDKLIKGKFFDNFFIYNLNNNYNNTCKYNK
jgi:hypothetical protein